MMERRLDCDGRAYSWDEFRQHHRATHKLDAIAELWEQCKGRCFKPKISKKVVLPTARHALERDQSPELVAELTQQVETLRAKNEELSAMLEQVRKELVQQCLDPISHRPMSDPVLAPDLHTYERQSIEEWHRVKPSSPMTKAPMEITTLRSNRHVKWLVELVDKLWGKASGSGEPAAAKNAPPEYVKEELPNAISAGNEELALELLARPIDDWFLNCVVRDNGEKHTLLHLALLRQCPRAARALAARKDFRRACNVTGGVLPIHLATALGYVDVCKTILQDVGEGILYRCTERKVSLTLESGKTIILPESVCSWELARSHQDIRALYHGFTKGLLGSR